MHYLIYSSKKTPSCNEQEINSILKASEKNNPSQNITGILLSSDEFFFQYLEGDIDSLFKLYFKIKEDKRHTEVVFLGSGIINERLFPTWNMGFKNVNNDQLNLMIDDEKSYDSFHAIFSEANNSDINKIKLMRNFFFLT